MASIKELQAKLLDKIEEKYKGGVTERRLNKIIGDCDHDQDGQVSADEFSRALEVIGSPLTPQETQFLFRFWDTMADQRAESGFCEVGLMVADLMSAVPTYGTGFNSGAETLKTNKGGRGNLPSQSGGIFGGGAFEADSMLDGVGAAKAQHPPMDARPQPPSAVSGRPKGNQSSIEGGIFGAADPAPPPSSGRGANKSNRSSVEGGIFGAAAPVAAPPPKARYSNQSSIPGGIFGSG